MIVPYCMIHYGKPLPETLGAIGAGLILGTLAMRTQVDLGRRADPHRRRDDDGRARAARLPADRQQPRLLSAAAIAAVRARERIALRRRRRGWLRRGGC